MGIPYINLILINTQLYITWKHFINTELYITLEHFVNNYDDQAF